MSTSPEMLWSPEEDAILKEKFSTCDSIKEVMPFLPKRSYNAIRSRSKNHLHIQMKVPVLHDTTYFDTPTEVNCSVAGFLAADGCVSDIGRLTIRIASKDRDHLVKIVELLKFSGKIYDYTNDYDLNVRGKGPSIDKITNYKGQSHTSSIQVGCPYLCAKLHEHWNITPRKTFTLTPPNLTDDRLILSFISGFTDGDGWITAVTDNKQVTQYGISVMGTKEMMQWIKDIFDRLAPQCGHSKLEETNSENIYVYKISGVKVYWLSKMFLSMDIPRLERKWSKVRSLIEKVETGTASQRFKTGVVRACPSAETLALFGLTEGKNRLFASVRPSVQ